MARMQNCAKLQISGEWRNCQSHKHKLLEAKAVFVEVGGYFAPEPLNKYPAPAPRHRSSGLQVLHGYSGVFIFHCHMGARTISFCRRMQT